MFQCDPSCALRALVEKRLEGGGLGFRRSRARRRAATPYMDEILQDDGQMVVKQ